MPTSNPEKARETFTELKTKLGIRSNRDPLVNEKPTLSDEDYIAYLKAYIANGTERLKEAEETEEKYREGNKSTKTGQYFKELINGMATQGVFDVQKIAAGITNNGKSVNGDAYISLMFRHAAGLAEIAYKETQGRLF